MSDAKRSATEQPRRIVAVAFDNSDNSQYMFRWAKENILRPDLDHVLFLTALSMDGAGFRKKDMVRWNNILNIVEDRESLDNATENAHEMLSELAEECKERNITSDIVILSGQDPKIAIVETVKNRNVALVLVGSRGLGKIKRALLGSVSDYVVHRAACPVLVVQERETEKEQEQVGDKIKRDKKKRVH